MSSSASASEGARLPLPTGSHAVVTAYGESQQDAIEKCIQVVPQPPPLLSELQDGDIVVAVEAAEVVWTDTVMATGQYQHQPRLPYTPGSVAGRIVWTSDAAKKRGLAEGQRVLAQGGGPRSLGRHQKWGGCATYAVAPSTAIRKVPAHWTFAQAACFGYGYDTVHYCLVECAELQKGQTILIHGATGGVGIPAVRMAKVLGATVIAATRSNDKAEFLKGLGADHVVCIADEKGELRRFREDLKQITNGKGVDVVYDGVGGDGVTVESMYGCAFGAKLLIVGWAATPNVAAGGGKGRGLGAPNPNRIPTNLIMMKGLRVIGCPAVISLTKQGPEKGAAILRRRIADLECWIFSGELPAPVIAKSFPLGEIKAAFYSRITSGSELGSTVVCPPLISGLHDRDYSKL
eukprot:gnl/TRDRNA2_/TRDRNA2_30396_c0_seq1.p1 gnl/TRDRNA2_/TRDRNA2_30396_c0~~gnl/TRDRNA2_/TRDRNA2_30396_c0_seq1.p1  ORF type:complete len:420 (+),score=65.27 gnl/TRDRNA2_/TRDRNA2_30396_c0_seq1:46-1260(+)